MTESMNPALSAPILPTFLRYCVSATLGLVAITTSSLVDGVFVGNYIGGDALAAITLLVPCLTGLFATALMFAIGGSVAAGKHIGAEDPEAASAVFTQTLVATFVVAVAFALASHGFERQLYAALGVPDRLQPMVEEYFRVIRWVLVVQLTTMVLYYFVRADGFPVLATIAVVVGALSNVLLDALFVVKLGLGLEGAAYAVAISQLVQAAILAGYFVRAGRSLRFTPRMARPTHLAQVAANGASELINELSVGLVFWLLNTLMLTRLGVAGVASFSVVNYYIFLSLMLAYGIADALHLLVSQNFGAGERRRIRQLLQVALVCSLALGAALTAVLLVFRHTVTGLFVDAEEASILEGAVELVLVIWPLFLVNGTNVILSCYLTAIHQPRPSALIATMRGLLLPAGLLLVLSWLSERGAFEGMGTQWSFVMALPVAEWATFALACVLAYRHRPEALHF